MSLSSASVRSWHKVGSMSWTGICFWSSCLRSCAAAEPLTGSSSTGRVFRYLSTVSLWPFGVHSKITSSFLPAISVENVCYKCLRIVGKTSKLTEFPGRVRFAAQQLELRPSIYFIIGNVMVLFCALAVLAYFTPKVQIQT